MAKLLLPTQAVTQVERSSYCIHDHIAHQQYCLGVYSLILHICSIIWNQCKITCNKSFHESKTGFSLLKARVEMEVYWMSWYCPTRGQWCEQERVLALMDKLASQNACP